MEHLITEQMMNKFKEQGNKYLLFLHKMEIVNDQTNYSECIEFTTEYPIDNIKRQHTDSVIAQTVTNIDELIEKHAELLHLNIDSRKNKKAYVKVLPEIWENRNKGKRSIGMYTALVFS